MAKYSEDSILKSHPGEWRERDVCQEYITPDCLKHAGVPEMSTKALSSFMRKKNKPLPPARRLSVIAGGMNNSSAVPKPR